MNIIQKLQEKIKKPAETGVQQPQQPETNQAEMSEMVLRLVSDGIIIINEQGVINFINPAAATMTGNDVKTLIGLNYLSAIKLENGEGLPIADDQNPLISAVTANEAFSSRDFFLVTAQGQKTPIALTLIPANNSTNNKKIITMRDITKEREEEGEQTEFISTASHEMRTPVASIEGYLGLALNPQTATIDARARQYLDAAHASSQHLGKLFRDLLDVTKLDDKRLKVHMVPAEMTSLVRGMAQAHLPAMEEKRISFSFGSQANVTDSRRIEQLVYCSVDVDFLREIMDNLVENAIKYTEEGGAIYVNVLGDGDRALINVTDTGIGISPDDLGHIFQKFYRADNSQTRTIGGTGLGLYLVKQRVEAMGGKVWAESSFGEGSTFYVSLPRLTPEMFAQQQTALENQKAMQRVVENANNGVTSAQAGSLGAVAGQATNLATPTTAPAAEPVAMAAAPAQPAPAAPAPAAPAPTPTPVATPEPAVPAPTPTPVATPEPAVPTPEQAAATPAAPATPVSTAEPTTPVPTAEPTTPAPAAPTAPTPVATPDVKNGLEK